MTWQWWDRNKDGFWCGVCGELLKPAFHFNDEDEMDDYEPGFCRQCGAPDEIDPEAI